MEKMKLKFKETILYCCDSCELAFKISFQDEIKDNAIDFIDCDDIYCPNCGNDLDYLDDFEELGFIIDCKAKELVNSITGEDYENITCDLVSNSLKKCFSDENFKDFYHKDFIQVSFLEAFNKERLVYEFLLAKYDLELSNDIINFIDIDAFFDEFVDNYDHKLRVFIMDLTNYLQTLDSDRIFALVLKIKGV